jgi:hypothetical protein
MFKTHVRSFSLVAEWRFSPRFSGCGHDEAPSGFFLWSGEPARKVRTQRLSLYNLTPPANGSTLVAIHEISDPRPEMRSGSTLVFLDIKLGRQNLP